MEGNEKTKLGRRALLAAGAAGVAAAAAQAVGAPVKVAAADGDPLTIGRTNSSSSETILQVSSSTGLSAWSTGGDGLAGGSSLPDKSGVYGYSTSANGHGVWGRNMANDTNGGLGSGTRGVYGSCAASDGIAVMGESSHAEGVAIQGWNHAASTNGGFGASNVAVFGYAPTDRNHWGLDISGRVSFSDRSGLLTIAANRSSISTAVPALTAGSMVLATLQTNRAGIYIQAAVANPATGRITIYLNKRVTAATKAAYFVLD